MERYRVRASFNNSNLSAPRSSSSQSKPCSQISLPPKPPISSYLGPRIVDDAEISIFDAERYFNEGIVTKKTNIILNGISNIDSCETSTNPRDSPDSSVDRYASNWRSRSFRATPTASSEASWNSQSGLLSNPPNSVAVSLRAFPLNDKRKGSSSIFFPAGRRFFGRNCSCYSKKSVDVEEKHAEPKSPVRFSSDKISTVTTATSYVSSATKELEDVAKLKISARIWAKDHPALFSPEKPLLAENGHRIVNSGRPFVKSAGISIPILAPPPSAIANGDEQARDSLEMFRPSDELLKLRRLAEFNCRTPAISGGNEPARDSLEVFRPSDELVKLRRSVEFLRRPPAAGVGDDVASDTSSELFEIESFSTHSAYRSCDSLNDFPKLWGNAATASAGILQFRRSLEETTASIEPNEYYTPSEVSVEWSVTTAEGGFDQASVANFSSADSDYEEARFLQTEHNRFGAVMMAGKEGGNKKKGTGGGLLSCRGENSVNVGPSPVRIGPEQGRAGTVVLAVEPDRVLGRSRFAREKAELVRSYSARLNRAVHTS